MNSIWNKNIQAFKERFPALIPLIPEEIPPAPFQIVTARSGDLTATVAGRALHSQYNPLRESQQLVQSNRTDQTFSAAFFSFGLGYAPIAWAKAFPNDSLIIIEPDPSHFFFALSLLDWTPLFSIPKCILALGAETQTVISLMEQFGGVSHCTVIANATQMAHASDYFSDLTAQIEKAKKKATVNSFTLEKFSHLWLRNSCKNLEYFPLLSGINRYKNKCPKDLGVLILAAGPTLQEVLPHLTELKKRFLIVAVDTALRACLKVKVEPDFILLVDPQYYAWRHLAGLESPSSILITESAAYPSVYRFKCREILQCASLFPLGKYFEKRLGSKGTLEAGGSVSTTAWDFGRFIGSTSIFFAGLDLGYPGLETHIRGSTFEEKVHSHSTRINPGETAGISALFGANMKWEKDYAGRTILTDDRMTLFAWWFSHNAGLFPQIKTSVLSDKSLAIEGFKTTSPEALLSLPQRLDLRSAFLAIQDDPEEKQTYGIQFKKVKEELIGGFDLLYQNAKKALNLCQQGLTAKNPSEISTLISSLEKIDSLILHSELKEATALVFPTERKLEEIFASCDLSSNPTLAMFQRSKIIYRELQKGISEYSKLLAFLN